MQTFVGLTLDTTLKGSPEGGIPSRSGLAAIQYVLNAFLVLNILQFIALVGLAHLDRRRKLAIAVATSIGTHGETPSSNEFLPSHSGIPRSQFVVDDGNQDSIRLPIGAREGPYPSTSSPEQRLPLLMSGSEGSLFMVQPQSYTPSPPPTIRGDTQRTKRIKRGELFAGLCFALIAFAWALFLGTAWLRLRSKAERGTIGQS